MHLVQVLLVTHETRRETSHWQWLSNDMVPFLGLCSILPRLALLWSYISETRKCNLGPESILGKHSSLVTHHFTDLKLLSYDIVS
jgi:hypothetical protein